MPGVRAVEPPLSFFFCVLEPCEATFSVEALPPCDAASVEVEALLELDSEPPQALRNPAARTAAASAAISRVPSLVTAAIVLTRFAKSRSRNVLSADFATMGAWTSCLR